MIWRTVNAIAVCRNGSLIRRIELGRKTALRYGDKVRLQLDHNWWIAFEGVDYIDLDGLRFELRG